MNYKKMLAQYQYILPYHEPNPSTFRSEVCHCGKHSYQFWFFFCYFAFLS